MKQIIKYKTKKGKFTSSAHNVVAESPSYVTKQSLSDGIAIAKGHLLVEYNLRGGHKATARFSTARLIDIAGEAISRIPIVKPSQRTFE